MSDNMLKFCFIAIFLFLACLIHYAIGTRERTEEILRRIARLGV
jgi:hypothetical protein